MRKKWLYIVGIILIVVPLLFLYVSFNGNPISKWKAKQIGAAYLSDVYEENYPWIHKVNYNFKDGTYFVRYSFSDVYSGTVEVGPSLWPQKVVNTYVDGNFMDFEADDRISNQASRELKKILAEDFSLNDVLYAVTIPTTSSTNSLNYNIRSKTPYKPSISIYLPLATYSSDEVQSVVRGLRDKMDAEQIYYLDFWVYIEDDTKVHHQYNVRKEEIIEYR